jgi:hypothetical protein
MSDRIRAALAAAPARGQLVRHTDGGIYRFVGLSQSTEDQSLWHLYDHVWPFDASLIPWSRPSEQWGSRFVTISEGDLTEAMKQDRIRAQEAIQKAKAERRAKASAPSEIDYGAAPLMRVVNRHTGEVILDSELAGNGPGEATQRGIKHD